MAVFFRNLSSFLVAIAVGQVLGQEEIAQDIQPLLKKYCYKCHGNKRTKADLNLEALGGKPDFIRKGNTWEKVSSMLRQLEMPPEEKIQPSDNERLFLVEFIDAELAKFDCSDPAMPVNPGRVTLRRLNRSEYNNTVRDLFGVDYRPAADFPNDEVGYGFDNIGDVLSLSPILMEKYLSAAEQITAKAIRTDIPAYPPEQHIRAKRWGTRDDSQSVRLENDDYWGMWRNGSIDIRYPFKSGGEYVLSINAYATLAGLEPPKMEVRLDDKSVRVFEVKVIKDERRDFIVKLKPSKGVHKISVAYLNNYVNDDSPDPALRGDRNLFVKSTTVIGPLDAPQPHLPESHRRVIVRQAKPGESRQVARESLAQFAEKAYRRPVAEKEVNRLLSFVDMVMADGGTLEEGMQLATQAILVSPHFLFRWELDTRPVKDEPNRLLNDWELASRLSYFLWSSMPDAELFRLAKRGELTQPDVLAAQVRRMVADPRSRALVENFAGQWLQTRNLDGVTPDPLIFPSFDDDLRAAMKRETELFFGAVMKEDRSVMELIDANFTYLNGRLARHYGIDGVSGSKFQRVSLGKDSGRGGILTHASILTITSNPTRTSPVSRGKWILEQILGTPPPPPPADVELLSEDEQSVQSGSMRQRFEQHRAKPECATCHEKMDPIGFAFEHYNAIGAWRDMDGKFPIDSTGELPTGEKIDGADGLKKVLKSKETFIRALCAKMLTYSLGRGLEYYDKCAIEEVCKDLMSNDYRFSALLNGVVNSKPFLMSNTKTQNDE